MKRYCIFAFLWLVWSLSLSAQMQRGYVKTLGRPTQKGRALSGVSVRVKGEHNAVLSAKDGTFAMPMPGKKPGDAFSLQQVQKQGYDLKDKGTIGRSYAYSDKVPLTLVMFSRSDYQQEKQQIENDIYATVENRYKADLVRLEQQKNNKLLSIERYREELQQLQNAFEKVQVLVEGLAEHYAQVDYDDLNDKEMEINFAIEHGELEKADSLLQLLGIQQRAQDIAKRLQAGEQMKEEAHQEMAEVLKRQEKDAEYLYQLYTIALGKFDNEKARFYIETRAELDTTNVEWQTQTCNFLFEYLSDYKAACSYAKRALRVAIDRGEDKTVNAAEACELLGATLLMLGDVNQGKAHLEQAHAMVEEICGSNHVKYAESCINMGALITAMGNYKEALQWFEKALPILKQTYGLCHEHVATCLGHIGNTYYHMTDYNNAEKYYKEALDIRKQVHDPNSPQLARNYNHLASVALTRDSTKAARIYCNKALEIFRKCYGEHHHTIALLYNTLGQTAMKEGKNEEVLEYFMESLNGYKTIFGPMHPDVASCYSFIGRFYFNLQNYEKSLEYRKMALDIYEKAYGKIHPYVAMMYNDVGNSYSCLGYSEKALAYYNEAVTIYERTVGTSHPYLAVCYSNIAIEYDKQGNHSKALEYCKKALPIMEKMYDSTHPDMQLLQKIMERSQ